MYARGRYMHKLVQVHTDRHKYKYTLTDTSTYVHTNRHKYVRTH